MKFRLLISALLLAVMTALAAAQPWPSKIRGYKLHDAGIVIDGSNRSGELKPTGFEIIEIGLAGATLEITAEITSRKQGGEIYFITFHDFRVNAVPVEIEEYRHPFKLTKGKPLALSHAARIHVRTANVALASYRELLESKEVDVTGTAFVFGKFKKFGFSFKRFVPIKIDLKILNPFRGASEAVSVLSEPGAIGSGDLAAR